MTITQLLLKSLTPSASLASMRITSTMLIYIFVAYVAVYYTYYFSTKFERTITVSEEFLKSMATQYTMNIVSDTNGRVYELNNSYVLLKFKTAELMAVLKPGKTYHVKGYGVRIPLLNFFENIYSASEIA